MGRCVKIERRVKKSALISCLWAALLLPSCEFVDNDIDGGDGSLIASLQLSEVAEILSQLPMEHIHIQEVHDAVSSSSSNGYDEEYTMQCLFGTPGAGVGDPESKADAVYDNPLRNLIESHVRNKARTKSSSIGPDEFLQVLSSSELQIYWPFSEDWDGRTMPVITFDPEDGANNNVGYRLVINDDGSRAVEEVIVDEEMAASVPVWVVNRNSDAGYTSLEMLRREDPQWGEGGGTIVVKPASLCDNSRMSLGEKRSKLSGKSSRSLVLKDFTMKRNYDSWFAGASEFFVKIGYVDDFIASTEAELKLFNPLVTDFMVVVKRKYLDEPQTLNVLLMTDWSDQMTASAFMITEDDGGTQTEWVCRAKVFIESKSYGIDISLPIKTKDEIVWRGELSNKWLESNAGEAWSFGDVDLTFELIEY